MTETTVPDEPKDRVVADFNAMADTYDTLRFVQIAARRLVDLVSLPAGAQVLDVATGTGWTALAAAQRVGPTGTVVGIDLAPDLLARARQKMTAAGLTNVEFRIGDAERLDFADQQFDVVLCTTALFFVPDMLAALRECWRVLKPGGQVGFSAWGPTVRQPLQDLWSARLRQYGVPRSVKSGPNLRLEDLETCRRLLQEAGFGPIEVQRQHVAYSFRTAEEWWTEMWTSRSRLAVLQLAPAQRPQFQAEHLAEVAALATDQGIGVDVAINVARGWKRAAEEQQPSRMAPRVGRAPWREIVRLFLTLGALSPGGPGLIGVLQTEVQEKRGWLSQARFVEGVALVNMLPGPSGAQLSIFLGYIRAGWWGGLLAGLCFLLPSFVVMLTLTLLYTAYGALPGLRGVFRGLNPVVVGIFAVAVYRLSRAAITDVPQGVLALAGALALGMTPLGIVPLLLLAGALGVVLYGSRPWGLVATTVVSALQGILIWSPPWLHLPVLSGWASNPGASPHPPGLGQIGLFFVKVGLFTFGGGLVLLAFLQDQVVQHFQWLTPQVFLDGLALGRLTPGPIPMLAAFIGYNAAGLWGAVVAGVAIFVPSFVLLLSLLPMLEYLERVAWLNAARQGMSPAIIGMIAVALMKLLPTAVSGLFPGVLALATVGAMLGWRVGPVPLMAVGAALGAMGLLWGAG